MKTIYTFQWRIFAWIIILLLEFLTFSEISFTHISIIIALRIFSAKKNFFQISRIARKCGNVVNVTFLHNIDIRFALTIVD